MSVLVKGMEKPEHCGYCRFRYDGICHALQKTQYSMDECPLVGIDDVGMSDLISRQAAIDALNKMKIYRPLDSDRYVISDCLNKIISLPSAERKGKWITYYHGGTNFSYSCNQCGADAPFLWNSKDQKKTRYCYNCGARMEDPKLEISSLYGKCVTDGEE